MKLDELRKMFLGPKNIDLPKKPKPKLPLAHSIQLSPIALPNIKYIELPLREFVKQSGQDYILRQLKEFGWPSNVNMKIVASRDRTQRLHIYSAVIASPMAGLDGRQYVRIELGGSNSVRLLIPEPIPKDGFLRVDHIEYDDWSFRAIAALYELIRSYGWPLETRIAAINYDRVNRQLHFKAFELNPDGELGNEIRNETNMMAIWKEADCRIGEWMYVQNDNGEKWQPIYADAALYITEYAMAELSK